MNKHNYIYSGAYILLGGYLKQKYKCSICGAEAHDIYSGLMVEGIYNCEEFKLLKMLR